MNNVHFSSATDQWATPQSTFDTLDKMYGPFDLDVCADRYNKKCINFISVKEDGLHVDWSKRGSTCWMNPPYGRQIGKWIKKAYEESQKGCVVVCLLPARTDTKWWHDYCMKASEILLVRGRLKFGGSKNSAPFPSAIVVFTPDSSEVSIKAFE